MNNLTIQKLINQGKELLKFKPQPIDPYNNLLDHVLNSNNSRCSVVYPQNDFTSKCEEWINDVKNEVKDCNSIVTISLITENIIEEYAKVVEENIHYLESLSN